MPGQTDWLGISLHKCNASTQRVAMPGNLVAAVPEAVFPQELPQVGVWNLVGTVLGGCPSKVLQGWIHPSVLFTRQTGNFFVIACFILILNRACQSKKRAIKKN